MKKVHFYLRESKSKRKTVYLCIRKGRNNAYRKSLKFQVLPSDWSKKTMRVKYNATIKDKHVINNYLNDMERSLIQFFNEKAAMKQDISIANIRDFVLKYVNPVGKKQNEFLDYLKTYRIRLENRLSCSTGKPITQSTKDKFRILFSLLKNYQSKYKKTLCFDDINITFYNSFVVYMQNLGYANNTIGKYIRSLKTIMNEAVTEGLTDNLSYRNRKFKSLCENTESVYLTTKELNKIRTIPLPQSLDCSRKLFLIGCYTGLRYSDFSRLCKDNIYCNTIRIVQKKTGNLVIIPLHNHIKETVLQVDQIKIVSNAEMNRDIKTICKIAGIKSKVVVQTSKGGNLEKRILEKWQLVCTHTARRTFATNCYLEGVPPITIMKITGHRTETAFMRYIKISQEENARILEKHWRHFKS